MAALLMAIGSVQAEDVKQTLDEPSVVEEVIKAPIKKLIEPPPVVVVDVSQMEEQADPVILDGKVSEKPEQSTQLAKTVMGWLEFVTLPDISTTQKFKAKLDTGAKTSSLNGRVIDTFEKDGDLWVRFEFLWHFKHETLGPLVVEAPVKDGIKIKQHHTNSRLRYTVIMPMNIGDVTYYPEFSLADRNEFNYPVLLGREFLKQIAIVDPSEIFLVTTSHEKKHKKDKTKEPATDDKEKADNTDKVATTEPVKK